MKAFRNLAMRLTLSAIFSSQTFVSSSFAEPSAKDEIRIGVIAGLTGEYAAIFQNWVNGINLAAEKYAKAGRKPALKLIIENDQFKSTVGLSSFKKLTEVDKVDALLNGSSATIGAIAPLLKQMKLPMLQLGEETEEPQDDNIVQIMPGNIEMERGLGKAAATFCPKDLVGFYSVHATMLRFWKAFKQSYALPLTEVEMDPAVQDIKTLVLKALASHPPCLAVLAFPPQGVQLLKEVRQISKVKPRYIFDANFTAGILDYEKAFGDLGFLSDDLVVMYSPNPNPKFSADYKERFGEEPGIGADLGYDSIEVITSAYSADPKTWIGTIKSGKFQGIGSEITFDQVGIRRPQYKVVSVKDYLKTRNLTR